MLHRYLEAADDCAAALRLDPTATKLHARRGRALLRLGSFALADEAFQRVLESSSKQEDKELEAAKTDARYVSACWTHVAGDAPSADIHARWFLPLVGADVGVAATA